MKKTNKIKVVVVTGTRAEYGLLYWLMKTLKEDPFFDFQLVVTGMHLSSEFGLTYRSIESDGFKIDKKIEMLLSSDSPVGISKAIGLGLIGFSEALTELQPNLMIVLGDRFEIFSAVSVAMILRIPVAHCHGGESTEGLIDESIRHSVTKMSHIHFTATEEYKHRVIQLGEDPNMVFNVGALGIENINRLKLYEKKELEKAINFKLGKKNILVTFHPVTLEKNTAEVQFKNLLKALDTLEETHIIFTKPNADMEGRGIIDLIDSYVLRNPKKSISFVSMGQQNYLSALKNVDVVVGNSSSGLIEAPSFKIATINIGDRQRGRLKANSVVDCEPDFTAIKKALNKVYTKEFQTLCKGVKNPYGDKNASDKIVNIIKNLNLKNILKKKFFNIDFKVS